MKRMQKIIAILSFLCFVTVGTIAATFTYTPTPMLRGDAACDDMPCSGSAASCGGKGVSNNTSCTIECVDGSSITCGTLE